MPLATGLCYLPPEGGGGVPAVPMFPPPLDCDPALTPPPEAGGGGVPGVPLVLPSLLCDAAPVPPAAGGGGVPALPTFPDPACGPSPCEAAPPAPGGGGVPAVPIPELSGAPAGELS